MKRRLLNFLITLDQLLFSILTLGDAAPDESMSAAAYRLELQGRFFGRVFRPLIDALFFFDANHCAASYLAERNGSQDAQYHTL